MHALKDNHNAYKNEYSEDDRKYQLFARVWDNCNSYTRVLKV